MRRLHTEPRERIKPAEAIIDAFARRDVETFVGNMTEDVILRPSAFITGKPEYRGHEEVRRGFEEMDAELKARGEQARISIMAHYVDAEDDSKILTLARVTIQPATGDQYGSDIAYLATLHGGLVSELETWLDHRTGLAQLRVPFEVPRA